MGEQERAGGHGTEICQQDERRSCPRSTGSLLPTRSLCCVSPTCKISRRGTKYSSFPRWLDSWLRMRKQLGLLMLFSASVHACIYLLTLAPHSGTTKIPTPLKNGTWDFSQMISVSLPAHGWDWRINSYLMAGVIGYAFAILLGLTSLPSISSSLSWREFRLFQSYLGWICLITCTAHCILNGWKKLIEWEDCIFPGSEQMALVLPAVTIVLKIPLLLPCVDSRLT